jgi:hypothetical protein
LTMLESVGFLWELWELLSSRLAGWPMACDDGLLKILTDSTGQTGGLILDCPSGWGLADGGDDGLHLQLSEISCTEQGAT